jgi:lysyl-tRNA synthetase class 2
MTMWQPSASIAVLRKRAIIINTIRTFFHERNYLEVETPIMARFGTTDVYLTNIHATFRQQTYLLQTSPEYHMKRLLAAGSGAIFQLARVFRDDELGRWHNPEFTLLEYYQLAIDHHALLVELDDLLQLILACPPLVKITYQQIFQTICNIDPFQVTISQLQTLLIRHNLHQVLNADEQDVDQYLFLLMSHIIEPALANSLCPVAIYDFPPSQASLAKVNNGYAERFEIYFKGVELANGFHELTDSHAQKLRFEQDCEQRRQHRLPAVQVDEYLLDALSYGLPACSGVAIGVDRLVALALGQSMIAENLAFDFSRA